MGITSSSVTPNPNQNETIIEGIYEPSQYKWTPGEIAANIRQRKVTPIYERRPAESPAKPCFCSICFCYYQAINEVTCCNNAICTECLAVCVPKNGQKSCPFCRANIPGIRANVTIDHIHNKSDEQKEEDLPDELLAIFLQYPNVDRIAVIEMYKAGVPIDEILDLISAENQ